MRTKLELHKEVMLSLTLFTDANNQIFYPKKNLRFPVEMWNKNGVLINWELRHGEIYRKKPRYSFCISLSRWFHIFYHKSLNLWCECHGKKWASVDARYTISLFFSFLLSFYSLFRGVYWEWICIVEFVRTIKCVFNAIPLTIIVILKQLTYSCIESNVVDMMRLRRSQRVNH